ncbi:MAG: hypothetical protein ACTSWR_09510 [Candidatus Helarchaeota archaeon]
MNEEPEKKDFLTGLLDNAKEFVDGVTRQVQDVIDNLLGTKKEEGKEPEGISKIISDICNGIRDLLGLKGEEGEGEGEEEEPSGILKIIKDIRKNIQEILGLEGGFNLEEKIRDIRNQIREILGMEPLPEEEV